MRYLLLLTMTNDLLVNQIFRSSSSMAPFPIQSFSPLLNSLSPIKPCLDTPTPPSATSLNRPPKCLYLIPTPSRGRQKPFSGTGLSVILFIDLCQMGSKTLLVESNFQGRNSRSSPSTGGSLRVSQLSRPSRVQCSMYCFTTNMEFLTRIFILTRKNANLNCFSDTNPVVVIMPNYLSCHPSTL